MASYDLKRLEVAIQYIRRMSDGKNPVTNRPAPENEVLNNMNVHRCLKFIDEVLTDVHKSGGTVGMDQQISYFLKQLEEYLPEGQKIPVPATTITLWMRENGYLEKKVLGDTGKENSVPTRKGENLGLYMEKAGTYPNEYYRVFYNESAQRFIIDNFRRILTESEEIRERNRREKKKDGSPRSARQSAGNTSQSSAANRQGTGNATGSGNLGSTPQAYMQHNFETSEPAPVEDVPQEYYDMLSEGWAPSDDGVPW